MVTPYRVFPACCTAVATLIVVRFVISMQNDLKELQQSYARLQRSCVAQPDIRPDSVTMKP